MAQKVSTHLRGHKGFTLHVTRGGGGSEQKVSDTQFSHCSSIPLPVINDQSLTSGHFQNAVTGFHGHHTQYVSRCVIWCRGVGLWCLSDIVLWYPDVKEALRL